MHTVTITIEIDKETWNFRGRKFRIAQAITRMLKEVNDDLPTDQDLVSRVEGLI